MDVNVIFRKQVLEGIVGGISALDTTRLNISDLAEAENFVKSYGYDLSDPDDEKMVQSIHRRAVVFLKDHLLVEGEQLPDRIVDSQKISSIAELVFFASKHSPVDDEIRKWSCALLKVMHVYAHLESDIFHLFPEEIKNQVLKPFKAHMMEDSGRGKMILGRTAEEESVVLEKFEIKPTKSLTSSVIKLLAKREAHALTLMDKIGVRFITKNVFDSFRVLRYLHLNSIISFPHTMVDQVTNTVYPTPLFLEVMDELRSKGPSADLSEVEAALNRKIESAGEQADYIIRGNHFSGTKYRFMKFITRRLIKISLPDAGRTVRFFYPFEIQLMDYEAYLSSLQGEQSHAAYKKRQLAAARKRILFFQKE